jgi:hypothetical protein
MAQRQRSRVADLSPNEPDVDKHFVSAPGSEPLYRWPPKMMDCQKRHPRSFTQFLINRWQRSRWLSPFQRRGATIRSFSNSEKLWEWETRQEDNTAPLTIPERAQKQIPSFERGSRFLSSSEPRPALDDGGLTNVQEGNREPSMRGTSSNAPSP